jgi:preprotein translocase subunit SecG
MELFESILWVLFVFACIIVSGVILLQEGKGGGLGEAFGGAGQQTFGVKAAGINKFTGWVAFGVVLLAILITRVRSSSSVLDLGEDVELPTPPGVSVPAEPGPGGDAPAGGGQ